MPTPFPGMDPYLERPESWQGFHTELAAALQRHLAPLVRPRYYVALEERVYVSGSRTQIGRPDVTVREQREAWNGGREGGRHGGTARTQVLVATVPVPERVRERYLEVRAAGSDEVVTVIELLSPSNKRRGAGRDAYEEKRLTVLGSRTNLVEIDLLRAGEPMPASMVDEPLGMVASEYRVLVAPGDQRPYASVYAFSVRDAIPELALPLRPGDTLPTVALQRVLHELYDALGYDLRIDYTVDPVPPLRDDDATWAADLLAAAGLR